MASSTIPIYKYSIAHYPRLKPELPLCNYLPKAIWVGSNDYPRVTAASEYCTNQRIHQLCHGHTFGDSILRSQSGSSKFPEPGFRGLPFWCTSELVDDDSALLTLRGTLAKHKSPLIVVPILRHTDNLEPENLSLIMVSSAFGSAIIRLEDNAAVQALVHILEDATLPKVILNCSIEMELYWTVLKAGVCNVHCITCYLREVVKAHGFQHWDIFTSFSARIPSFDRIYHGQWLRKVVINTMASDTAHLNEHDFVKTDALLHYAKDIFGLLDRFSRDRKIAECSLIYSVSWEEAMRPLRPYLQWNIAAAFWNHVGRAMSEAKSLYIYVPLWINAFLREGHSHGGTVEKKVVDELYQNVMDRRGVRLYDLNETMCVKSADAVDTFLECMCSKQGCRAPALYFCRTPGCYRDVFERLERIAPLFVINYNSGY